MLASVKSAKEYPDKMRRIKYVDPQTGKSYPESRIKRTH